MNKKNKEKVKLNVCLIKDCDRRTHKESKYCIFHAKPKEKSEEEFKIALKKYIEEIKEEDKNYDFEGFIFIGNIDFKEDLNITIFKGANFNSATFEREACFIGATFKGDTWFDNATFKEYTSFAETTFKEHAGFYGATFKGMTGFENANFQRDALFERATFNKLTSFFEATFKDDAYFKEVTFKGDTSFFRVNFREAANFEKAAFLKEALFKEAIFNEDMNFQAKSFAEGVLLGKVRISPGKKLNPQVENNKVNVSFERAYLENVYLDMVLSAGVLIDFTDAFLRNTKIKRDQIENHIFQEKEKEFSEAKQAYLLLKNNFHSIGRYDDESWAFKKEKDMERLSYSFNSFTKNIESKEKRSKGKAPKEKKSKFISFFNWLKTKYFRKWLYSCFFNIIYGYGERPQNVIFSAIFIIILFSIFFSILGINSLEIIEMESPTLQEIFSSNSEIVSKGNLLNKTTNYFIDCLHFSTITFTTLGYGDFRPLEGWGRICAGTEAFIGALMMALFVYTFARRTGGR